MKKSLLGLLLALATSASAEVKITYYLDIPQQQKPILEQKIKTIANKYMKEPYADLGSCDFLGKEDVNVRVVPFSKTTKDLFDDKCNSIQIKAEPSPMFEYSLLHEFSHAYDWNKDKSLFVMDQIERMFCPYKRIEERATRKEYLFLEEIKDNVPKEIYNALIELKLNYIKENNLVPDKKESIDWYYLYVHRQPIIRSWEDLELSQIKSK